MITKRTALILSIVFILLTPIITAYKSPLPRTPRCNHDEEQKHIKIQSMPQRYPKTARFSKQSARSDDLDENGNTHEPIAATGPLRIRLETKYIDAPKNDTTSIFKVYTCADGVATVTLSTGASHICRDADRATTAKINYIKELMEYAVDKIQSLLDVVQVEGGLSIASYEYSPGLVVGDSSKHDYTNISNADLYVFVTARPAGSDDVYATGRTILTDNNNRPILGQINWNPSLVNPPSPTKDENYAVINGMYRGVAFHEMLHVLGFSSSMFTRFRDSNGKAWPQPVKKASIDGRDVTFLTTPRVLEAVRLLHGCKEGDDGYEYLKGAAVEDQGGAGTAGSHWEKAAFLDEVMTGTASYVPVISNVTLAALEDSGWYKPHYDQAEWLAWGENKGCKFSTYRCVNGWPKGGGYFCSTPGEIGCTYSRKAVGGCQIGTNDNVEAKYKYLENGLVGADELADYCPYTRFYSNTWCTKVLEDASPNDYGETYDGTGRCFKSSVFSSLTSLATQNSYKCYPTHCTSPKDLKVKIGEYWYACHNASTTISPKGYYGKLHCAAAAEICPKNTPIDDEFPTIISIEPDTEYPGNPVTIRGTHLNNVSKVEIGYACNMTEHTDTKIVCTLSKSQSMQTILGTAVDVVLIGDDISLVEPGAFVPKVAWKQWAEENAFLLFSMLLAVLCLFLTIGIIFIKVKDTRARNKKRHEKRVRAKRMALEKSEQV